MPVDSTHLDYDANLYAWLRARDVFAGEDAVKAGRERYLPKLESQTTGEYDTYRARAAFFNATARTADGFVGLIFRREPTFKRPENSTGVGRAIKEFIEDADMLGTSLLAYAKNVTGEVIAVGRAGTLVDWESASGTGVLEQRAYAVLYRAEDIVNWRTERVNGRNTLTLLVLREQVQSLESNAQRNADEFAPAEIEQLRVLKLAPVQSPESKGQGQWQYVVEVWRPKQERNHRRKVEWVLVESRTPLRLGKPLPLIPFVFHGPRHSLPGVEKLPLADIIAVNLDHYRLDADYKHGLHYTALPTAWVAGFDKGSELRIGSSTAWVAESQGAMAGFLEFTGQGLTTFERAMDRDERLMAVLGTRMLEAQKRVGETAEAIELRQSGETSVLTTISQSVGESLTQVLRWVYWWNSTEESPEDIGEGLVLVKLNEDFSTKGMSSEELTAVVAAWQAGAISQETMFGLFRKGEVIPTGRTDEEEARLTAGSPKTEIRNPNGGQGGGE
jgi:hypothetical protein